MTKKGAKKNVEEWKRFLITWKSKVKGKARNIKKDQTGTGGGPATNSDLTDFEERLMVLIGWNTIEGCDSVAQELVPGQTEIEAVIEEGFIIDLGLEETEVNNGNKQIEAFITVENETAHQCVVKESILTNSRPVVATPRVSHRNKKLPRKNTKFPKITNSESLNNAAKIYYDSSQQFAQSAALIATSIEKLAVAITKYAEATLAVAEAKKEKYAKCNCKCVNTSL